MKMIDVFNLMAKGEIEKDTKLIVSDGFGEYEYKYKQQKGYRAFYNNFDKISKVRIDDEFRLDEDFLNLEVELIEPKPKKYLVKFNMRGWKEHFRYLNYYEKNESIEINTKRSSVFCKASFTKDELQSIQPVREFLEDMEGKYELMEVEENEND